MTHRNVLPHQQDSRIQSTSVGILTDTRYLVDKMLYYNQLDFHATVMIWLLGRRRKPSSLADRPS